MAHINIQIDDELKKQAEMIFSDIGLSTSMAIIIFFKQVVKCNGIPFELKADAFYSRENQMHLGAAKERMEKTGGTQHEILEPLADD